jgi:transposase
MLTVLLRDKGLSYQEIGEAQGCSPGTVCKVLKRYQQWGEAGLEDRRSENGHLKADEDYLAVLCAVLKHTAPHYGWSRPTWTRELLIETMRKKTRRQVSRATMSRALKAIGARLGRPKPVVRCPWSKHKVTRRLNQIHWLRDHLPSNEILLYEDEADVHLNPKIGLDWMNSGDQRQVVTPGQNKKRYLAGAWDPVAREMTLVESERKNSFLFILLCQKVLEAYPKMKKIHLVLDNYGIHKSKITKRALEGFEGRIVLHFLPPYCPDENLIEIRWKILHDNVTRNHQYKTIHGLMGAVRKHLRKFMRKVKCAHAKVAA